MPTFIDRHCLTTVITAIPSGVRRQLYLEARQHLQDARGVRARGRWAEDGALYCLLDAPDAVAACQYHLDRGLRCEDLHAIDDLDGRAPISDEGQARVRAAIARLSDSVADKRLAELRTTLDETINTSQEHVA